MADGQTVDNGALSDFTWATDDAGASGQVPIVKLAYSADGSATLVLADSNGLEVQLGAALPAGTNAIGKLAANSGVDIGDVDDVVAQGKLDTIITLLGSTVATQVWKSANYTTAQTGAAIWTPGAGKKIAITHLSIGTYDTTAARLILWFGASGDTTYSAGTDQLVFAASFAPSASGYPGAILQPASPILSATADYVLRITTDAALDVDIAVYGYEFS